MDTSSAKIPRPSTIWSDTIRSHTSDLLPDNLHWLCVLLRIAYKLCLITYKSQNDRRMSDYISNFCSRQIKGYDSRREIFYSSHGLLRSLATVPSLSQEY